MDIIGSTASGDGEKRLATLARAPCPGIVAPMPVLALSSHVAVGHAGNSAACPALERLGFPVWRIDTTLLSNHPGHSEGFRGRMTAPEDIDQVLLGIDILTGWHGCVGAYTGYMGEGGTPAVVASHLDAARAANPDMLVLTDPVIGDHGRIFVRDGVEAGIRDRLLPRADVITPNAFELSRLSGNAVTDVESASKACEAARAMLRAAGPQIVVATGVPTGDAKSLALVMAAGDTVQVVRQTRHDRPFFGTGDLFAGLFLSHLLKESSADASARQQRIGRHRRNGGRGQRGPAADPQSRPDRGGDVSPAQDEEKAHVDTHPPEPVEGPPEQSGPRPGAGPPV